jgi:2-polyprenyl-6-methoxyphenol hydroxylase-like FAD-dependent oxidoreductase
MDHTATVHDVLIVGAGPAGLALGAELQRLGTSSFIIDQLAAGANTSRAVAIHARTLEVLEPLGVVPELISHGLITTTFRIRDRDRILATFSFKDLKTNYPFVLLCPQNRTETILLQRLESLGGSVSRPHKVTAIRPAQEKQEDVEVQFEGQAGLQTVRARWVVGCDGAHSVVREQAGIPFQGGAYDEDFILADVEMDSPFDREEVDLFFSDQGLVVVAPLPGNHFRIVATVDHAPENPSLADFQKILDQRGPTTSPATIRNLAWSTRFHIQHRVAQSLRKGRVLLVGDAAHVHSPAGGQGMNTGIQDAVSLADVLHGIVSEHADLSTLDAWEHKRLEIARSVVNLTDRMTKAVTVKSTAAKLLRNAVVDIIGHIPAAQHAIAERLSELDNR